METMRKIKFKKIKETDEKIFTNASVPVAKGVYLSGWLIIDSRKDTKVIPPFISYRHKNSGKTKYKALVYFAQKDLKTHWLNRIKGAYQRWKDEKNSLRLLNYRVKLFKERFRGREDVFAKYWESRDGRRGYQPACKNEWKEGICHKPCFNCINREYLPLTEDVYGTHLKGQDSKGKLFVVGVYPLLEDNTSYFIAADFDGQGAMHQAKEFMETCSSYKIPTYLERSRSGIGYHVWIFFEDKIPAWKTRAVILEILKNPKLQSGNSEGFDRLFPNQDRLTGRGLGNLIALPLQGQSVQKGFTLFLNPEIQFEPYKDQWEFLRTIKRIGEQKFDNLIKLWDLKPNQQRTPPSYTLGSQESLEKVIQNCDFIRYCINNAENLSEPLWYCMISNLAVFEGGVEKIHKFSRPYPRYTWAETERKISHALEATGPHQCHTIRKEGFNCIKDCGVRSPAGLGYRTNNTQNGG